MSAIEIPEDVVNSLRIPERDQDRELRLELAVSLYARGALSFGKARSLAGLSKLDFQRELADREIERHYTGEELEEDMEYAT